MSNLRKIYRFVDEVTLVLFSAHFTFPLPVNIHIYIHYHKLIHQNCHHQDLVQNPYMLSHYQRTTSLSSSIIIINVLKLTATYPTSSTETEDRIQNYFCQQMHCLLKHKMLQFVLKISLCMAPTCFGPSWTIIREHTMEPC